MHEIAYYYSLLILFCTLIFKVSPENVLIVWCLYNIHSSSYSLILDLWFAWWLRLEVICFGIWNCSIFLVVINILENPLWLRMVQAGSSKIFITIYKIAQCHNPEDQKLNTVSPHVWFFYLITWKPRWDNFSSLMFSIFNHFGTIWVAHELESNAVTVRLNPTKDPF
jgi:hypothetical protein